MRWVPHVKIDDNPGWHEYGIILSYGWTAGMSDEQVARTEEGERMEGSVHFGLTEAILLRDKLNELIPQIEKMGTPPPNNELEKANEYFSKIMYKHNKENEN